ncbi:MAG: hypothetical protein RL215_1127, partial [Planctomycetota bacterium]
MNFKPVSGHAEAVLSGDFFEEGGDVFVAKFNELAAFFADEVIVLWVAVVVFIDFAVVSAGDFANESGVFEFADGAIDGCAADASAVAAGLSEACDNAVAVEMFVFGEDFANDGFTFLGKPFAASREEFAEFLEWRNRHMLWFEGSF